MDHPCVREIFTRTAGIALVRPALQVDQVDMTGRLRRIWLSQRPSVGLIIGNGLVEGTTLTMHGITTTMPTAAVVDLLSIPSEDPFVKAGRLLTVAKNRLAVMLRGEANDKRLNILVAFIDGRETLEELARRIMHERNLSTGTCMAMHEALGRPGDGIVVNGLGHLTDRPIIPRQPHNLVVSGIFQAKA